MVINYIRDNHEESIMILKTVHLVETENVTNHNYILELHYILDTIMDVMLVIKSPQQTPVLAMWTRAMGKMLLPHLAVTSRLMNQGSLQKKVEPCENPVSQQRAPLKMSTI